MAKLYTKIFNYNIYLNANKDIIYKLINVENRVITVKNTDTFLELNATEIQGYRALDITKKVRYDFNDDFVDGNFKEEKTFAFFYTNAEIESRVFRWDYFYNYTANKDNLDLYYNKTKILNTNIKKLNKKMYLEDRDLKIKSSYKINPYNNAKIGEDPFSTQFTYKDIEGVQHTVNLLDAELQNVFTKFVFKYKEIIEEMELEYVIENNLLEVMHSKNVIPVIGKTIDNYTIKEVSYTCNKDLITVNLIAIKQLKKYDFLNYYFSDNCFVFNKNFKNGSIIEKINSKTGEIDRSNTIELTENLDNIIADNFLYPADYVNINTNVLVDTKQIKNKVSSISYTIVPSFNNFKIELEEQLLNASRQLKRNIIVEAEEKMKEQVEDVNNYNQKKMDSFSAKADFKLKLLEEDYNKVIEEKRAQVRKDERAILQLANFIEKTLENINVVNTEIVKQHNKLMEKVDKDMPLIQPNAFSVDSKYPDFSISNQLTDAELQKYIEQITAGTYKNPFK